MVCRHKFFKIFITIFLFCQISSLPCKQGDPQTFVTFHPHLDAFWLNTDKQLTNKDFRPVYFLYQMNQRNTKEIFNSMLRAFKQVQATRRRYFITQVFFLKDWYDSIPESQKNLVKTLIASGQLQIANSGWVENDQAVCYYDDIIQQYTVGMNYLYKNFGYVNQIGWATDSFGHSHSQVALLYQLGFVMQFIERVDDRYIHFHQNQPLLQFYWKPKSDSNNRTYGGIFTHIRSFLHEVNNLREPRVNLDLMRNQFKAVRAAQQTLYKKKFNFRFLGNDFQEFIPQEFKFLENVMKQLNTQLKCDSYHYGNPTQYLVKLKKYQKPNILKVREYDFLPNWDHDRYWTGYYTTYPNLKKNCKDSSRLLNWFRRQLINKISKGAVSNIQNYVKFLEPIQQNIAIMQHHDGITATSKHYIQLQMVKRMNDNNIKLIYEFKKLNSGLDGSILCELNKNNNQCIINVPITATGFVLLVYNSGTVRKDRIEISFQKNQFYKLNNFLETTKSQIFCYNPDFDRCRMIIQANFANGFTRFNFASVKFQLIQRTIVTPIVLSTLDIQDFYKDSSFNIQGNDFIYKYGNHYYKIGLYQSQSIRQARNTVQWDKYNVQRNLTEFPSSGLYIMFNNGQIRPFTKPIKKTILKGKNFLKIIINFDKPIELIITVQVSDMNTLDVISEFTPTQGFWGDYFIRIQSDISTPTQQFYHDSNGYLVIKRKLNTRPDYQYKINPTDKINGNTYPATSFAYIQNNQNKMVVGLDRAYGVALYNQNTLIVNIDRLTNQDGKGAGESFSFYQRNIFRHKISIVSNKNDIERRWQKAYDQCLVGFYASDSAIQTSEVAPITLQSQYLKMSTALLDDHTILIRVQNLGQFSDMNFNLFNQATKILNLPQFKLRIQYRDMVQTYLNGIPLTKKHEWLQQSGIIDINRNSIVGGNIKLQPLQIRSFKLDLSSQINKQYKLHTDIVQDYIQKHPNADPIQFYIPVNRNARINQNQNPTPFLPPSQGQFPTQNPTLPVSQGQFPAQNEQPNFPLPISQGQFPKQSDIIAKEQNTKNKAAGVVKYKLKRCF